MNFRGILLKFAKQEIWTFWFKITKFVFKISSFRICFFSGNFYLRSWIWFKQSAMGAGQYWTTELYDFFGRNLVIGSFSTKIIFVIFFIFTCFIFWDLTPRVYTSCEKSAFSNVALAIGSGYWINYRF